MASDENVTLSTYVDLAVSVASQSRRYRESQTATSCYPGTESKLISQDNMRADWISRIRPWLVHNEPFDKIEDIKDFTFGAFFVQHPVPAMHLWNVMQEFYKLDRVVCCNSEESELTINNWKLMGFFEYLKSKKVEKRWRNSLDVIKRSTDPKHGGSLKLLPPSWSAGGNDRISPGESALSTESRISNMEYGVQTLAEAWEALQRSWEGNLTGDGVQQRMLSQIKVAVERRFTMVDKALRLDTDDALLKDTEHSDELIGHRVSLSARPETLETRSFMPLRRVNSNALKEYVTIVISSSKEGEPTPGAIFVMFVVLIVLYQLLQYLKDTSI